MRTRIRTTAVDHDDDHDDKEDAADEEEEEEEDAIRYAICETAYDLSIQYTHEKDYIPGICEMGFQTSVIQVSAHDICDYFLSDYHCRSRCSRATQ